MSTKERKRTPSKSRSGNAPVAHLLPPGSEIRPGAVAYCGTRIIGIPATRDMQDCTMCRAISDERRGKI